MQNVKYGVAGEGPRMNDQGKVPHGVEGSYLPWLRGLLANTGTTDTRILLFLQHDFKALFQRMVTEHEDPCVIHRSRLIEYRDVISNLAELDLCQICLIREHGHCMACDHYVCEDCNRHALLPIGALSYMSS